MSTIRCKLSCYDVWDESYQNIPCNMYSQYSIGEGLKLFYSCCNTFSSKNCFKENISLIFSNIIFFDNIVLNNDEQEDYHLHIHHISNYAFFRHYHIFDFFVSNIYLYRTTCHCTQYLIDQACQVGYIIKRNTEEYYPVNFNFNGYKLLNYKQIFYLLLNYLINVFT